MKLIKQQLNILKGDFRMICKTCGRETEDYQKIIYKNKEIRIYKWENKVLKDFSMPKDFDWCEFQIFNELIENDLIKLEKPKDYFVKHFNQKQWNKEYCLSRVYVNRDGDLDVWADDLADSDGNGRVVIIKELGK